jgi:hypothetical protein
LIRRNAMPRFYASAALCATLTILAPCFGSDRLLAASPAGAADTPEHSVPQSNDGLTLASKKPLLRPRIRA